MNLFCCSRFIFSRRFSLLPPLQFFFLPLYFIVAALVFCLLFTFFSPLQFFVVVLTFYCHLLPLNRRRKYKAARKEKKKGRRQSNNKAATKNMERLRTVLLSFRNKEHIEFRTGSKHKKRRKTKKKKSFPREQVENTDLHEPVLDKVMTTQEQCAKYDFLAPLNKYELFPQS